MKILVVSYFFPPGNAIGAVRVGKMAKCLQASGHEVRVLTAEDDTLPQTLPLEVPPEVVSRSAAWNINKLPFTYLRKRHFFEAEGSAEISRLESWGGAIYKALVNVPDGQVGWLPFAVRQGRRLIKTWRPDVIYASAKPFTSLIVAALLSKMYRVPWIAEYRDLWTDSPYYDHPSWRHWLDRRIERAVVRSASGLVTVSEPLADALRLRFGKPTTVILNGFDPEDYPSAGPVSGGDRRALEIVYTGMIYPGRRDPTPLFRALAKMGPSREQIRVRFLGRILPEVSLLAKKEGISHLVEVSKALPYQECLQLQQNADVLLLLLWNDPREEGVYTGKLFEYLAAGRPILVLGLETGVAAMLVRERGAGVVTNDPDLLAKQLQVWLDEKREKGFLPALPESARAGLSRYEQFAKLDGLFQQFIPLPAAERVRARVPEQDRRKVLVVVPTLNIGGTEKHLLQVLPRLAGDDRLSVQVFVLHGGGQVAAELQAAGVPVIDPSRGMPGWLARSMDVVALTRWLMRERPTIVHFFLPEAYILGGVCALWSRHSIKIMSRRNLNNYQARHAVLSRLERFLHGRMHAVLGNSRAVVEQLRGEGVPDDKVGLIYNGIDPTVFRDGASRAEARAALGLSPDETVFIVVANLISYKGHVDLLQALALTRPKLPEKWTLLCVGRDDGKGKTLKALAADLGLDSHVRWLGEHTDVLPILRAASIGILPSHEEGFSNSILECMAAGLPMIVTNVGGNPEAVVDGVTGLVVPSRDPVALSRAILTLANDPRRCHVMGMAGKERVATTFSLDQCVAFYEHLYKRLAERADRPLNDIIHEAESA